MFYSYDRLNMQLVAGRYRAPNSRDIEVQRLIEEGRVPSPRIHDEATIELYDFCYRRRQCRTEFDLAAVYQGASHIAEAVHMHDLGCHGPGCTLEALVLADEDPERIAKRMATTEKVVNFYEQVFCDIRTKLSDHDFIVTQCIGLQTVGANREKLTCAAMKFFAYSTGSTSIDLFAFPAGAPHRWQSVSDMVSAIGRRARLSAAFEALQNGQFADPRAKQELLRVIEALEQSNDNHGDEVAPKTKDERIVANLLEAMGGRIPGAQFRR